MAIFKTIMIRLYYDRYSNYGLPIKYAMLRNNNANVGVDCMNMNNKSRTFEYFNLGVF